MNMNMMNMGSQSQPSSSQDTMDMTANKTTAGVMSDTGGMSGMSGMSGMTFFISTKTPLFIQMWAPKNMMEYAASCFFLIALAIFSRVLLAVKARLEVFWDHTSLRSTYMTQMDEIPKSEHVITNSSTGKLIFTPENGKEEVIIIQKKHQIFPSWRLTVDPLRAALDTLIAAVGFFLMLAVMTMNIGYFFSILVGTYIGSLAVGRIAFDGH